MNEITTIYQQLWDQSVEKFRREQYELDPLINDRSDTRRGLTLIARFDPKTVEVINNFLYEARRIDPGQYYYPASDLHLTVLSVISCTANFSLKDVKLADYKAVINQSLAGVGPLKLAFKGITASPSCILLQGIPQDNQLNNMRARLRAGFKNSNLQHSIDSRYAIKTAHSSIIRFQAQVKNSERFINLLEKYRDFDFGTLEINELEFVFNDWYQKQEMGQILHRQPLIQPLIQEEILL